MESCGIAMIDRGLSRAFHWLGVKIGENPSYFLIVPLFVSLLLGTGLQRLNYVDDPEYLFSPTDGAAKRERVIMEDLFPMNYTHRFHPSRFIRPGRFARLFITAQDRGTLLRDHVFREIQQTDQLIHNISFRWTDDQDYHYSNLCAAWECQCYENDVIDLVPFMDKIETQQLNMTWPFFMTPNTFKTLSLPFIFGGYNISSRKTVESAKAIQLNYFIAVNTPKQDSRGEIWEQKVLDKLEEMEGKWKYIAVSRFTVRTLAQELERNTFSVLPYFPQTTVWMTLFMIGTCLMMDWVKSKPWLGIVGVISACLGSLAAFGLVCYLGVEFIGINMAAPFLMLGIGIDDTFVMLASWRRTSPHKTVSERLGETYGEAAVSITITSVTDMLSFWVGVITPFPCVQIFSIYSGAAVVATYIYHIFFFGGAIALSGYDEKDNKHGLLCCYTATPRSQSVGKSFWFRLCCVGGINPEDPHNPLDNPDNGIMVFFRDQWASFINHPFTKLVVLGSFIGYLGISCYGITQTQEGLERRKLTTYDSYAATFFNVEDLYFRDYPYRIQVVISGDLDYSNKTVQHQIETLMEKLETSPYTSNQFTECWLRNYLTWINRSQDIFNHNISTEAQFIETLTTQYVEPSSFYYDDIHFNPNKTRIMASRFVIQSVNIADSNAEKDMAEHLRHLAKTYAPDGATVTVYHPLFIFFDQFLLIRQTSINCVAIAAAVMMGVSLIFIPSPICSLWVAFSIISIEMGVVGFMALWHVNLDAISMMNLIMCIGFSVDFSAHISYAYIVAEGDTPEERVRSCLYSLGLPIVQGAASTILAVAALLMAPSYIFIIFFKVIFLVIVIAAAHGLLLLPVLLSLFGPGSYTRFVSDEKVVVAKPRDNDHKDFPSNFVATLPDEGGWRQSVAEWTSGSEFSLPRPKMLRPIRALTPPSPMLLKFHVKPDKDLGIGTESGEDNESRESNSSYNLESKYRRALHAAINQAHNKSNHKETGYLEDSDDDEGMPPPLPLKTRGRVNVRQPRTTEQLLCSYTNGQTASF